MGGRLGGGGAVRARPPQVRGLDGLAARRVVIVGLGNSAADIAMALVGAAPPAGRAPRAS